MSSLVWMGDTAETAIDKIYAVYGGQTSVTNIIDGLKRDKQDGTLNPNFKSSRLAFVFYLYWSTF